MKDQEAHTASEYNREDDHHSLSAKAINMEDDMDQGEDQKDSPKGALASAIESWPNLLRAFTLFAGLMLIVVLSCIGIYAFIVSRSDVKIELTDKGGIVLLTQANNKVGQFLLPASAGWTNTGFIIKPGARVEIQSFGEAHLGFHRLVDAARDDVIPIFPWIGPQGSRFIAESEADTARQQLLIEPKAHIGMLLGYLAEPRLPENEEPGKNNPKPGEIVKLGDRRTIRNQHEEERVLWLTVNDMYLNNGGRKAYVGDATGDTLDIYLKQWNQIKEKEYWELWFNDNIGQYLITIKYIN